MFTLFPQVLERVGSLETGSITGLYTLLMGMLCRHTKADVNVIALLGERGREVREFLDRDLGEEGLKRSIVIVATSDQPALVRANGALVATAIAEYFRDQGKHVMLIPRSLVFTNAGSCSCRLAMLWASHREPVSVRWVVSQMWR